MTEIFKELLKNIKIDDNLIEHHEKKYRENIKQERYLFINNTTPKIYINANFENINKQIKNFINSNKLFCWIYGGYGTGKTYSLYAIRNYHIMQKGNIYFNVVMEGELNYDFNFKKIDSIDNLAISESKMKFLADFYFNLIDWCWKNNKKLYLTSTKDFKEWLSFFSKYNSESSHAIASRFSNNLEVINLGEKDLRKNIDKLNN